MIDQIDTNATDYDLECVPRAIYNDFLSEMHLREEGISGRVSRNPMPIKHLLPVNNLDLLESLEFLSRVKFLDEEREKERNVQ